MRLPVTPDIVTRNGVSNKNARLTNALKEKTFAVVRPGLELTNTYTGIGNGLIPFDGRLLVVHDDTVEDIDVVGGAFPLDSADWDAGTTYNIGDAVWYNGVLWFAFAASTGVNPVYGGSWVNSIDTENTYDPSATYNIGDTFKVNGVTYTVLVNGLSGVSPADGEPYSFLFTIGSAGSHTWTVIGSGIIGATKISAKAGELATQEGAICSMPDGTGHYHDVTDATYLADCQYGAIGIPPTHPPFSYQYQNFSAANNAVQLT
jgi:hypothetical protein